MTRPAGRRRPGVTAAGMTMVLAVTAGCGPGDTPGRDSPEHAPPAVASGPARPVVVDTDLASDDLVALALLLASPQVQVRAVTVSGTGEVRCPRGAEVARSFLAAAGEPDVPVACGSPAPLEGERAFPQEWRDAADAGWGLDLPAVDAPGTGTTASELLIASLTEGTTLLTLGPLTNVAEAFRTEPDLAGAVDEVVVMGGAVDVPGNVELGTGDPLPAEWNVYVDPVAAAEVLGSGARVVMVALDATNRAPITTGFVDDLGSRSDTLVGDLMVELLQDNGLVATGDAYFWDPLAAAVVIDRGLVTVEQAGVAVDTQGDDAGVTRRDPRAPTADIAVDADAEGLEGLILRLASGGR